MLPVSDSQKLHLRVAFLFTGKGVMMEYCKECKGIGCVTCDCHYGQIIVGDYFNSSFEDCSVCKASHIKTCSKCNGTGGDVKRRFQVEATTEGNRIIDNFKNKKLDIWLNHYSYALAWVEKNNTIWEKNPVEETIYIYQLIDPSDNLVKYVGQSRDPQKRLQGHQSSKTQPTGYWIKELMKKSLYPVLKIVDTATNRLEAEHIESIYIADNIIDGQPLLNLYIYGYTIDHVLKQRGISSEDYRSRNF